VVAQKRHLAWLEHTHCARGPAAPGNLYFTHSSCSSWSALEEALSPYATYMVRRSIRIKVQQDIEDKWLSPIAASFA
jgi:hypothetical protein